MSRIIVLDSGPLGMLACAHPLPALQTWMLRHLRQGRRLALPEIADYEVRRELLRADLNSSLNTLNALQAAFDYLPITTPILRGAASLWALLRRQGMPTADRHALDGDVILAATVRMLQADGYDDVVATTNVTHIDRLVPAALWQDIVWRSVHQGLFMVLAINASSWPGARGRQSPLE